MRSRLLLSLLGVLLAGAAGASEFHVPGSYATIQAAINAVDSADDVVVVADGTYYESLDISKSLTLRGTSEGGTIIDASGFSDYGVDVSGDWVTVFEYFTLLGPTANVNYAYGLKISGENATTTVHDVTIAGSHKTGLDLNGLAGALIYDVTSTGNGANGISMTDCSNVSLSGITTSGNAWGGVAIYTSGQWYALGSDNIVFSGVNSLGEPGAIYVEVGNYNNPSSPQPVTNLIIPVALAPVTFRNTTYPNHTYYPTSLANAIALALLDPLHASIRDRATGALVVAAGMRIQPAIDAAAAGDVVSVADGTYVEQLVITKNLTLRGAGAGTIVQAFAGMADLFDPALRKPVILVQDCDVVLEDLVVDGAGLGNSNNQFFGVAMISAGGTIDNVRITAVRDNPFSGAQHGVALYVRNDSGGPRSLVVTGCTIDDWQKNATRFAGSAGNLLTLTLASNVLVGHGTTDVTAQNGFQFVGPDLVVEAYGNDISGIAYDNTNNPIAYVATSVLNYYATLNFHDNIVSGAQVPIYNIDAPAQILDNTIGAIKAGVSCSGIVATDPTDLVPSPALEEDLKAPGRAEKTLYGVVIEGNVVTFTGVDNVGSVGLEAWEGSSANDIALTVEENTITGFDFGAYFGHDTAAVGRFASVEVHDNDLAGNTGVGLYSDVTELTIDGACNWWGTIGGPAAGVIVGDVVYWPWLATAVGPCDQYPPDNVGVVAVVAGCITEANACKTMAVQFNRADTTPLRAVSVDVQLSPELVLCGATPIVRGSIWDGYGEDDNSSFAMQVTNPATGLYRVDLAILGDDCGPTAGGVLFTMDVAKAGDVVTDDAGTITVMSADPRSCSNPPVVLPGVPGAPATISIDVETPEAVTDLVATQVKTGNDSDGSTEIELAWTGSVSTDVVQVEIWRKGYGGYPEYDDVSGTGTPTAVDGTWTHVATEPVSSTSYVDEPVTRDFWYYAVVVIDDCGNRSVASDITGGTLNYHLGDVSDGMTPGAGNNLVNTADISLLGAHYGIALVPGDTWNYLDVGPTTDYSTNARPTTDNQVQFEDLIVFAMNYGQVSKASLPILTPAAQSAVIAKVGEVQGDILTVDIAMSGDGRVQGLSVPLVWDADVVRPVGFTAGNLIADQGGLGMVLSPAPGTVDAAIFGARDQGICGTGTLATVTFKVLGAGDPAIEIGEVVARDGRNQAIAISGTLAEPVVAAPVRTELHANTPNPFNPSTELSFALSHQGNVRLQIYSVQGRLVATLVDGELPAGPHSVTWHGRDDGGRLVSSGAYIVRLEAPDATQSRRITLMK